MASAGSGMLYDSAVATALGPTFAPTPYTVPAGKVFVGQIAGGSFTIDSRTYTLQVGGGGNTPVGFTWNSFSITAGGGQVIDNPNVSGSLQLTGVLYKNP